MARKMQNNMVTKTRTRNARTEETMKGRTRLTEETIHEIDAQLSKAYTANDKKDKVHLRHLAQEIRLLANRIATINEGR